MANLTKPAIEVTLSLRMAVALCVSVVLTLRLNSALTSLLLYPSAIRLTTVSSRSDSSRRRPPLLSALLLNSLERAPL